MGKLLSTGSQGPSGEREWCVGVPVGYKNTARLWDGRPVFQTALGWGH